MEKRYFNLVKQKMFFLFFYYIINTTISKFSKKFFVSKFVKYIYILIKKVVNFLLYSIGTLEVFPKFAIKIIVWCCICIFTIILIIKLNIFFFIVLSYILNFKIKYQLFVYFESNFDPYSILKVIDFLIFYPVFYIYYYFFNDLNFSFQRIYYWFIYKLNNFGLSQGIRGHFMRNWSYGGSKYYPKHQRFDNIGYKLTYRLFKKNFQASTGKFPFLANYHYYLFFIFVIFFLIYLIYIVYFKDLKPTKYDMDESIRYDFFGSISEGSLRIEFNDLLFEKIEKKIDKAKLYPIEYISNSKNHEKHGNNIKEDKNSFDLIMNKFGIDGMSYLDEIRSQDKKPKKNSYFSYISFTLYFIKDVLNNIGVFFEYQLKFNIVLSITNLFYVKQKNDVKKNLINERNIIKPFFYYIFMFFYLILYIYLFIVLITLSFLILDFEFYKASFLIYENNSCFFFNKYFLCF